MLPLFQEYYVIREWLLPGWLMSVQAFVTLSFIIVFFILVILALTIIRLPLKFVLQYEWLLVRISYFGTTISCKFVSSKIILTLYVNNIFIFPQLSSCSWLYASSAAAPIVVTG